MQKCKCPDCNGYGINNIVIKTKNGFYRERCYTCNRTGYLYSRLNIIKDCEENNIN